MKKLTSGSQIDGVNYLLTFSLGNFILFTEFCNWNSADSINKVIIKTKKHKENITIINSDTYRTICTGKRPCHCD